MRVIVSVCAAALISLLLYYMLWRIAVDIWSLF